MQKKTETNATWDTLARSYAVQRFMTAALVFATALVAAWSLGPQQYGQLALMVFVGKMLLIGSFGSASGYIHRYYDQQEDTVDSRGYLSAYAVHLVLIALLAYWLSTYVSEIYSLGVLCFALLIPYYALEPVLRVRRRFYVSLLPDIVVSLSICVTLIIAAFSKIKLEDGSRDLLYLVLALMLASCLLYLRWIRPSRLVLPIEKHPMSPRRYFDLVRTGLPLYLGTAGFLVLLSVDRVFLEHFHPPEALGTYMLAFQLATGACLLLTAQNFVALVDYGELVRDNKSLTEALARRLKAASMVGALSFLILLGISYLLEAYFLKSYTGLARNATVLGLGLLLFHIAGSVTPIAFYRRRQMALTLGIFCLVVLSVSHNQAVLQLDLSVIWIGIFTGIWLSGYAVYAIKHAIQVSQ